jgi:hypothetical protein
MGQPDLRRFGERRDDPRPGERDILAAGRASTDVETGVNLL